MLNQLDIHHGTLVNYHQQYQESSDYLDNLKLLQYDMLYGEQYIYDGINPYEPTKLQMGVNEILISDVFNDEEGNLIIKGQNFTNYSRVKINDSAYETTYIDSNTLKVSDYVLEETDTFAIQQVTVTNHVLSTSAKFSLIQEEDPMYDKGFEEGYMAGYQAAIEALKQQTGEIIE